MGGVRGGSAVVRCSGSVYVAGMQHVQCKQPLMVSAAHSAVWG